MALGHFWARRARRLLPALFIVLIGVAAYAHFYADSVNLGGIRGDALATLAYVANWHYIFSDQGYFALTAAPSPLLHTWSLGVEEQYYLIWPLIALFVLRRWAPGLAVVAGVGALASAAEMASPVPRRRLPRPPLLRHRHPGPGPPGRLVPRRRERPPAGGTSPRPTRGWPPVGSGGPGPCPGLAGGAAYLVWAWHALEGQTRSSTAGVPPGRPGRRRGHRVRGHRARPAAGPDPLGAGALIFIGRISYGLYLYHWPLFLVSTTPTPASAGYRWLAVRLVATFVVATLRSSWSKSPSGPARSAAWRAWPWPGPPPWPRRRRLVAATVPPVVAGGGDRRGLAADRRAGPAGLDGHAFTSPAPPPVPRCSATRWP